MPVVFSGKLDGSEAVRYFHVSLVAFYLRQTRHHATAAHTTPKGETDFKESLLAVVFASLCLEAFANEMGENILPEAELEDFFWLPVTRKLRQLLERKFEVTLTVQDAPLAAVKELFDLRNELVHHKLTKTAAKAYLPALSKWPTEDGQCMTVVDFMQPPTRTEPALVARVDTRAAAKAYNSAVRALRYWNEKAVAPLPETLPVHAELPEG